MFKTFMMELYSPLVSDIISFSKNSILHTNILSSVYEKNEGTVKRKKYKIILDDSNYHKTDILLVIMN